MKPACLLLGFLCCLTVAAADVAKISATEAARLVARGQAVLVDVREPVECVASGIATPAVLLPKSDFDGGQKLWKEFLGKVGHKRIILYCRSGKRAGAVARILAAQGRDVANAGGFNDWESAGLPVRLISEPTK